MKRGKKLLLLLLALAVVSAGAWAVSLLPEDQEASYTENQQTVFSLEADSFTSLSWTYNGSTLAFTHTEEGWVYTENTAFPLDESFIETITYTLSEVTSGKVVETPGDLDQFGLAAPVCSITVNESNTLCIGNETAMGDHLYLTNGDGCVYLVDTSLLDCFQYTLLDLVKLEAIPDLSKVTALTLNTETETVSLSYQEGSNLSYSNHYSWFKSENGSYEAIDTEAMETLLDNFTNLAWVACADYQATDDSLASYGLDTPAATYTLEYVSGGTTGTFTIELGDSADSDTCYARLSGSSMVYLIDSDISTALIGVSSESLLVDDVLKLDYGTVDSIDITLDGVTYTFERTPVTTEATEGETTDETTAQEQTEEWIWTLNGEELALDDVLDTLTAMTGQGLASSITPERSSEIRFLFHRSTETFSQVELVFYQYDGSNCLVSLNGKARLLASRTDVVSLVEAINALVL